jgi:hypothetical protein
MGFPIQQGVELLPDSVSVTFTCEIKEYEAVKSIPIQAVVNYSEGVGGKFPVHLAMEPEDRDKLLYYEPSSIQIIRFQ